MSRSVSGETNRRMSFHIIERKTFANDVTLLEWCPGADLLAVVTSDSQLMVHRIAASSEKGQRWQRLFSHTGFDHAITSLAWRPDGQELAIGHGDGSVSFFGVEQEGEQLGSISDLNFKEQHIFKWVSAIIDEDDASVGSAPYTCSLAGLFTPLPQLPKYGSAQQYLREEGVPQLDGALYKLLFEPHSSMAFDIAVTSDADAHIHLAVHGRFSLGRVCVANLPALHFDEVPTVLGVQLAPTLHALTVVVQTSAPARAIMPDGARQEHAPGTLLLAFRTGQLTRARSEIRALALSFMQSDALATRAKASLDAAKQYWNEAIAPLHSKMAALAVETRQAKGLPTVAEQFGVLLACGLPSPALQSFFNTELSEAELLKALKNLSVAANVVTQLCLTQIHPALEMLLERLYHLDGLSKWPYHFAALGLQPLRVKSALTAAKALRASAELLLNAVRQATPELSGFIGWLLRTHRQMRDEPAPASEDLAPLNLKTVAAFLFKSRAQGGLPMDQVVELFLEDATAPPFEADELALLAQLPPTQRIPAAVDQLDEALANCFSPVAHHISAGFQLHSCIAIDTVAADAVATPSMLTDLLQPDTAASHEPMPDRTLVVVAMPRSEEPRVDLAGLQLALFRAPWTLQDADSPSWEVCALGGCEEPLIHACFYSPKRNANAQLREDHLALVHKSEGGGTTLALRNFSELTFEALEPLSDRSATLLQRAVTMLEQGKLRLQALGSADGRACAERSRAFKTQDVLQLAMSHSKGLAAIVAKGRRIVLLLDVEDDTDEDDDDDEGNEGEDVHDNEEACSGDDMAMDEDEAELGQ